MKKFFAILCTVTAFALATPVFANGDHESNPCGNHGNHCCTDDGGDSYDSVENTCTNFCESTAVAVSVAVSECEAKASATCKQECGDAAAFAVAKAKSECESEAAAQCAQECGIQTASAVAAAVANCAQTASNICNVPTCLKWRIRYNSNGQPVARICKKTTEQPITVQ
jgi:hypothetical protein